MNDNNEISENGSKSLDSLGTTVPTEPKTVSGGEGNDANPISRRTFLRAGAVSGSALLLAACGSSGSKKTTAGGTTGTTGKSGKKTNVDIWSWYTEDTPLWKGIQNDFHDAYPSLTVTPRTFGTLADYAPVIEAAVAAGNAPDILAPATLALSYGQDGVTLDLKQVFDSSFLNSFFPSVTSMFSIDGKQYGIGWEAQMFGFFYNPDILKAAGVAFPETWDDLIRIAPIIRQKTNTVPVAITANPSNNIADFFLPLITQASNDPSLALNLDRLTQKGLTWDSKPVTEAFATMQKLVDAKVFETGPTSVQQTESVALFSTGKAAMMFFGSFIVPPLLTSASKSFNKLYKVGMQPAMTAGAKHWAGNQCGAGWAINAHSSKTDAAATFLKWLYQPTRYATIMNNSNSMAATQGAALKGSNPRVREMASWIQDNGCCHILFGVGSFTAASNTAAAVIDGKLSPAPAAAKMQSTVLQARKV